MCYLYECTFQSPGQLPAPLNTCHSFYNYADKSEVVTMILGCFLNQIFFYMKSLSVLSEFRVEGCCSTVTHTYFQQQNFQLIP